MTNLYEHVDGAPFQPGDWVTVTNVVDDTGPRDLVGGTGCVAHLNYDCGCGQTYPGDPMIYVGFPGGRHEEFWKEELRHADPFPGMPSVGGGPDA